MNQMSVAEFLEKALSQFARICSGLAMAGVFVFVCELDTKAQAMEKTTIAKNVDCLIRCHTTQDLEKFYRKKSLGGRTRIQNKSHFVFVQTFPYSGVYASHLFVYEQEGNGLNFRCFIIVKSQEDVKIGNVVEGFVEITVDTGRVAVFPERKKATK